MLILNQLLTEVKFDVDLFILMHTVPSHSLGDRLNSYWGWKDLYFFKDTISFDVYRSIACTLSYSSSEL